MKKTLSILLSAVMLLSIIPTMSVGVSAANATPNGEMSPYYYEDFERIEATSDETISAMADLTTAEGKAAADTETARIAKALGWAWTKQGADAAVAPNEYRNYLQIVNVNGDKKLYIISNPTFGTSNTNMTVQLVAGVPTECMMEMEYTAMSYTQRGSNESYIALRYAVDNVTTTRIEYGWRAKGPWRESKNGSSEVNSWAAQGSLNTWYNNRLSAPYGTASNTDGNMFDNEETYGADHPFVTRVVLKNGDTTATQYSPEYMSVIQYGYGNDKTFSYLNATNMNNSSVLNNNDDTAFNTAVEALLDASTRGTGNVYLNIETGGLSAYLDDIKVMQYDSELVTTKLTASKTTYTVNGATTTKWIYDGYALTVDNLVADDKKLICMRRDGEVYTDASTVINPGDTVEIYQIGIDMTDGASIRLSSKPGMRWRTIINKADYDYLAGCGIFEIARGTLIVASSRITDYNAEPTRAGLETVYDTLENKAETQAYIDVSATEWNTEADDTTDFDENYYFVGSVVEMKTENIGVDYTGIGYLTFTLTDSDDVIEIYADYDAANNRSINYIATTLYNGADAAYKEGGAYYDYVKEFLTSEG